MKRELVRNCGKDTYLEDEWEGGLGVFWIDGDFGTKIIAIPRLRVSTVLMNDATDHSELVSMLSKNNNFHYAHQKTHDFANMILRGLKGLKVV